MSRANTRGCLDVHLFVGVGEDREASEREFYVGDVLQDVYYGSYGAIQEV